MIKKDIRNILKEYGVNLQEVDERFMGDMDFYLTCVKGLFDENSFDELGQAIEDKDYKKAFSIAHMLKGLIGNLSLVGLLNEICSILESLRAESYENLEKQYKSVLKEYNKLKKKIF